jgi:hypothetical protein
VKSDPFAASTMHIAPLVTRSFDRTSVYQYRCFLAVGELPKIREAFYQIHEKPGAVPDQK